MPRIAHALLALCLCLAAACAPLFANKVLCTTDSGHRAIEASHELTGCPEIVGTDADHGPGNPEPCEDEPVGPDASISSQAKAADFKLDLAKAVYWLAAFQDALTSPELTVMRRSSWTDNSPLLPADLQRLSTVILLI